MWTEHQAADGAIAANSANIQEQQDALCSEYEFKLAAATNTDIRRFQDR